MDKCELLARLTAGGPVADLPSPEINLIAASIAKLSEGKAPLTMGQKRLYIENWLTDNKEDVPAHVAGLNGGASLPESPPARSSAAPPEPVPPPASGGIGRSGDGLARSPPLPGSLARAAAAPPPPSSPAPPARGAAPPADLSSVHGILSTIGRYAGAPLSPHDVLQLADAIQRVDHTRQPATLSQKRVYVDDFFRAKTGAAIAGSAPEGTRAPSSSASPAPPEPDAPESGGALLEAVRAALARGGGRLGSAQEALTLAAAVHGFTGMPTDGSNPQEYVADWYNWVRHAAQPLPPPALPQLDDGVPLVEAACGRPARAAPSQAAAPDGGGAEGALWAMVSSLSSQVQSLSSQVATSREKTSEQQAALLQQQAAAQAAMARQALDAMQLAIQAAGGGGAQHRAGPDTRRGDESAGEADGEAAVEEEAAAPGPAPGSRADIEGQLLDYLRAQYEQGRDVPLDNLAKARRAAGPEPAVAPPCASQRRARLPP